MEKRGQLRISFGIIFSIFLIIVFLFFAFKVISSFMDVNECADIAKFYGDFQKSIDKAKNYQETTQPVKINLGSTVDKICFVDLNANQTGPYQKPDSYDVGDNFFIIYQEEGCEQFSNHIFKNLNVTKITETNNPNCFENGQELTIKKAFSSRIVTIE